MTNVDFENGVMTVNVELESRIELSDDDRGKIEDYLMSHPLDIDAIKAYSDLIAKSKDMSHGVISRCKKQKYEPKDGDFVYVRACYDYIAIFNKEVGDDMYVHANLNISFSISKIIIDDSIPLCCMQDLKEIRPATEIEKKILIDKLAEFGKRWNPKTKTIENVRWRAKIGESFYAITPFGQVDFLARPPKPNMDDDYKFYQVGNYFKIREAAEKVAEQIREIFKNSKTE